MKPFLIGTLTIILGSVTQQIVKAETTTKLYGYAAGGDYCRLRSYGIPHREAAITAVMDNTRADEFEPMMTTASGVKTQKGVINMHAYIKSHCPEKFR